MPSKRLKYFLESSNVHYQVMNHAIAFSALEVSEVTHVPAQNLAKTIIVRIPDGMVMCVVRTNEALDILNLKKVLNQTDVVLATEEEFAKAFPDCEVGAMPPFGNLYDMDVYVSDTLAQDKDIYFNAGNHSEIIKIAYSDYERLAHPKVARITSS